MKTYIICPECDKIQSAKVENTLPFSTYIHKCVCGYTITESEWQELNNDEIVKMLKVFFISSEAAFKIGEISGSKLNELEQKIKNLHKICTDELMLNHGPDIMKIYGHLEEMERLAIDNLNSKILGNFKPGGITYIHAKKPLQEGWNYCKFCENPVPPFASSEIGVGTIYGHSNICQECIYKETSEEEETPF